ncbi:hypothetical protein MMPV_000342 [Pyropia vietnamensis]
MPKMELGYWGIRGLANPLRLALEYAGVDYTDRRFSSSAEWHAHRDGPLAADGLVDFPSLPYLVVDEKTAVSQSRVILRFIAERHGFGGESEAERTAAAMVQEEAADLNSAYLKVALASDTEAARKEQVAGPITTHLGRLEAFLGEKEWIAGGAKPTYADLILFDILEWMWHLDSELKGAYPKLCALRKRVGELPAIAAYVKRTDGDKPYISRPFTPFKVG